MLFRKLLLLACLLATASSLHAQLFWSDRPIGTGTDLFYGCGFGANKFVTLTNNAKMGISGDGTTWSLVAGPNTDLLEGSGTASLASMGAGTTSVFTLKSGTSFLKAKNFPAIIKRIDVLNFSGGLYIGNGATGANYMVQTNLIFFAPEPLTPWTAVKVSLPLIGGKKPFIGQIAYGKGKVILTANALSGGNYITNIYYSPDKGKTWKVGKNIGTDAIGKIRFLNGTFLAMGYNSVLYTSPDGVAWTKRTIPTGASLADAAFGRSTIVAVGSTSTEGVILSSLNNGVTWVSNTIPLGWPSLNYVAFGAGKFVVVGYKPGYVLQSN